MNQESRQVATIAIAYGSWSLALGLTFLRTSDILPAQYSMLIVLFIGVGIAAGLRLSRMRLAHTMTAVFHAGMTAAEQRAREREERDHA